jgi:hypothetical protein
MIVLILERFIGLVLFHFNRLVTVNPGWGWVPVPIFYHTCCTLGTGHRPSKGLVWGVDLLTPMGQSSTEGSGDKGLSGIWIYSIMLPLKMMATKWNLMASSPRPQVLRGEE